MKHFWSLLLRQFPLALGAGCAVFAFWYVRSILPFDPVSPFPLFGDEGIPFSVVDDALAAFSAIFLMHLWYNIPKVEEYDDGDAYVITVATSTWLAGIIAFVGCILWYESSVLDLRMLFAVSFGIFALSILLFEAPDARKRILIANYAFVFTAVTIAFHAMANHWRFPIVILAFLAVFFLVVRKMMKYEIAVR